MLDIQHLSFAVTNEAAGKEILHDITLTVDSGRFVVITGPNGGGKSTLAKLIAGIATPSAGRILFDGEDITSLSVTERARRGISFAFQQPVRFKGVHVLDLIRLGQRTYAVAPAVPVTDTVKVADLSGLVLSTPDRSTLFAVQTPQVFQANLLKAALQSAIAAEAPLTDDCSAVERLGKEVYLTPGWRENIKITTPEDLSVAELFLRRREVQA